MNLIGYKLSAFDNGDYFYGNNFQFADICPQCGIHTNFQEHNPLYVQRRIRRSAVLYTYDGQLIINKAFKQFLDQYYYEGVEALSLINDLEAVSKPRNINLRHEATYG